MKIWMLAVLCMAGIVFSKSESRSPDFFNRTVQAVKKGKGLKTMTAVGVPVTIDTATKMISIEDKKGVVTSFYVDAGTEILKDGVTAELIDMNPKLPVKIFYVNKKGNRRTLKKAVRIEQKVSSRSGGKA